MCGVSSTSAPTGVSIQNPTEPLTVTGITLAAPFAHHGRAPRNDRARRLARVRPHVLARTRASPARSRSPPRPVLRSTTCRPRRRAADLRASTPSTSHRRDRRRRYVVAALESRRRTLAISALAFAGNAGDCVLAPRAADRRARRLAHALDFTPGDHGARTAQLVATSDPRPDPGGRPAGAVGPRVALTAGARPAPPTCDHDRPADRRDPNTGETSSSSSIVSAASTHRLRGHRDPAFTLRTRRRRASHSRSRRRPWEHARQRDHRHRRSVPTAGDARRRGESPGSHLAGVRHIR
jgi:hypothetical protein